MDSWNPCPTKFETGKAVHLFCPCIMVLLQKYVKTGYNDIHPAYTDSCVR